MVDQEKQIIKEDGVYKVRTYIYENKKREGHPLDVETRDATQEEIDAFLEKEKPSVLNINLLNESSQLLYPHRVILNAWLKSNKIVDLLFAKDSIVVNHENLDMMQEIIEEDQDDENSPLTQEVGAILLGLIRTLRGRLRSAS